MSRWSNGARFQLGEVRLTPYYSMQLSQVPMDDGRSLADPTPNLPSTSKCSPLEFGWGWRRYRSGSASEDMVGNVVEGDQAEEAADSTGNYLGCGWHIADLRCFITLTFGPLLGGRELSREGLGSRDFKREGIHGGNGGKETRAWFTSGKLIIRGGSGETKKEPAELFRPRENSLNWHKKFYRNSLKKKSSMRTKQDVFNW